MGKVTHSVQRQNVCVEGTKICTSWKRMQVCGLGNVGSMDEEGGGIIHTCIVKNNIFVDI